MKIKLSASFLFALLFPVYTEGKVKDLLPRPQQIEMSAENESFLLHRSVALEDPTDCDLLKLFLQQHQCTLDDGAEAHIQVELCTEIPGSYDYLLPGFESEVYQIKIKKNLVSIKALSEVGVIRAVQTLQQMAEGYDSATPALESLTITDWPAFKLRGLMHDVGRSFVSIEELKKEIDLLSRFKINVFHWHLTEKLAWRFEVKTYPQLTAVENMLRYPGCYYTQEECRELQDYATERGVTVIPEIDMPGHSDAFRKAMGFDMQSDEGVAALKNILDEVIRTFSKAPYIHIGGDEIRITYPNFLETMAAYVRGQGRKVVVWNRLVSGPPTTAVADMTQMWASSGQKVSGIPNIDCRYNYINHFDVYADVVGIYKSNIYYEEQGNEDIAGTITAIWNDTKTETQEDIVRQNNLYANALATAERAWIGGGKQYIETGGTSLPSSGEEYEEFADWERRFLFHKNHSLKDEPIPYVRQCNVKWRITDPFPNEGDPKKVLPPETDDSDLLPISFDYDGKKYFSSVATGAGIYLKHIWHPRVPSFYSSPDNGLTAYAWTYVYSPVEQKVGAQVEFYTYSRSGNEKAPEKGCWDRRGSRLWVNDQEIAAPEWKQPGKNILQDHATEGLTNENFTARPVVPLTLKQGWNKIFMKLPHASNGGTGRDKWQFTFVITDPEGKDAVDGLIYSPSKSMDDTSQELAVYVDSLFRYVAENFRTEVGYYDEALARPLKSKLEEVYASLGESMSETERMEQKEDLQNLLGSLKNQIQQAEINQPVASTDVEEVWYVLSTPLRGNRYPSSQGAGKDLVGETGAGKSSTWKFVLRKDGTYNIVNAADGGFVSPVATENSPLKMSATEPDKGWSISASDEKGLVILTSGTVQWNQTNNSQQGYKIFNWGGGQNITDTGCKYKVERTSLPAAPKTSSDKVFYWYKISTPLRDNLFVTSKGDNNSLIGAQNQDSDAVLWKLVEREDGDLNLVNRLDLAFISPEAPNNTPLHTVTEEPERGWKLQPANTEGYYIIVSGSSQMNQTNGGLGYQIYNWGEGKNITDTGCQFAFTFWGKEEGEATEVYTPQSSFTDHSGEERYFTLDGRELFERPARKGIYLFLTGSKVRKVMIK